MSDNNRQFGSTESIRRLHRRRRDALVFGVCAGIAEFFSADVTIIRIVAALLLWFFTLPTLVLYLGLALLVDAR